MILHFSLTCLEKANIIHEVNIIAQAISLLTTNGTSKERRFIMILAMPMILTYRSMIFLLKQK